MKKQVFVLFFFLFCFSSFGQKIYSYNNTEFHFSFDIPKNCSMNNETDDTGYFLYCMSKSNDTIFKIKHFNGNIDSAFVKTGFNERIYHMFANNPIKIVGVLYDENKHSDVYQFSLTKNQYTYIFLSNDKETLCIKTNRKKCYDKVFEQIIESFKFN